MPPGAAQIVESSRIRALLARRWSHRRPVPSGVSALLTLLFWGAWLYLVLPLLTAVLWFFGLRRFAGEVGADGYGGLGQSLLAYSAVLLALVALLVTWIVWNVVRYGGASDRRTVERAEVTDQEVWAAFRLDARLLERLRQGRMVRIDVDTSGRVVLPATPEPPAIRQPAAAELVLVGAVLDE
jgi:poly-beta-1,6-N-acetyl-D-glucosamine biosynthesis protein PgaD